MDKFHVAASDTELLERSHLVDELKEAASSEEMFAVLINGHVGYFHSIDGGYHVGGGYHVVNLIHKVQGKESPPNQLYSDTIEAHIGDTYYWMEVADIWQMGDYPDENFILSLKVTGYEHGPYAFSEALTTDVDKRETRFER